MARKADAIRRGLSAADALAVLDATDEVADALARTAPATVAALGGAEALRSSFRVTVAPGALLAVPGEIDATTWERMAGEFESRRYWNE
jgi:hypothetical protein